MSKQSLSIENWSFQQSSIYPYSFWYSDCDNETNLPYGHELEKKLNGWHECASQSKSEGVIELKHKPLILLKAAINTKHLSWNCWVDNRGPKFFSVLSDETVV